MFDGIEECGDNAVMREDDQYRGPKEPVAVFYGYEGNLPRIMEDYRAAGLKAVFIDMGYWGRRHGGRYTGYHKVSVNDRHPTAYFQEVDRSDRRVRGFGLKIKPWRDAGKYILLAGMSGRNAESIGIPPNEWEFRAVEEIRKHTDRPILYRPKPSWRAARKIHGTRHSPPEVSIHDALTDCHAVVTHHSNAAIDGLIAGVPAFCWEGVATPMALQDLSQIETPYLPEGREQWAANIAWCQWSVNEMRSGAAWRHLKNAGLVP